MRLHLYTLCWNEIDILPFVVDYWKRLGIEKAVVYDNGSTDGSIEFLQKIPFVELRHFVTQGMNDIEQRNIKSSAWKESKGIADYVIVCDTDEMIYSNDLESVLQEMRDGGYNVLGMPWYACCFDTRPQYVEGKLLHELGTKYYKQQINVTHKHLGKFMLFDPNLIDDMGFSVGCHMAKPTPSMKLFETKRAVTIHIDKGFSEDYFVQRRMKMAVNLSDVNKRHNYCFQYRKSEEDCRKEYRKYQSECVNVNDLIYSWTH